MLFCAVPSAARRLEGRSFFVYVIPSWARRPKGTAPALIEIERPRGAKRKRSRYERLRAEHRRSRRQERRVSASALYGKELPARLNGVKAQRRDRGGSPQARPVLSRGGGDR